MVSGSSRYPFTLGDALRESPPARPTAQTSTLTAPPSRRIRAHSATVLPVVITSSINATRAPGNVCPIAKAPSGLSWRWWASRSVCRSVWRTRCSPLAIKGIFRRRATTRANSSAWLKPRSRSRRGCSGTGMMQSGSEMGDSASAAVNRSPSSRA